MSFFPKPLIFFLTGKSRLNLPHWQIMSHFGILEYIQKQFVKMINCPLTIFPKCSTLGGVKVGQEIFDTYVNKRKKISEIFFFSNEE